MRRVLFGTCLFLVGVVLFPGDAATQEKEKKKKDGPPPMPGLLPPFVREPLKLTEAQEQKLGVLSSSIQIRLGKVLTDKQMQQLQTVMKEGPPSKDGNEKMMPKGPKRAPGLVIPPFVENRLQLTAKQQQQITSLERYARTELYKILTPAQQRQFTELMRRGPGDNPGGQGFPPKGKNKMPPEAAPPPAPAAQEDAPLSGIQWFATWQSGLKEAERTGRPILLVAAAPSCGGVSGIW